MRISAAIALAALALAASGAGAVAQEPAAEMSSAELHLVRGKLAFRRAVWSTQRDAFQRAVTELERARTDAAGWSDVTLLYLLGVSYLRLGRADDAEPVLRDARALAPAFPGLVLTDALRMTGAAADPPADPASQALAAIAKFDEYLAKLDAYPKDGAFAAELRFLGYFFRGRTNARTAGRHDHAIADLGSALDLARQSGEAPAAEVVSLLTQMHLSLDQVEEAKRVVAAALVREPAEPLHYYNFGVILARAQDDAGARPWFEAALARRPDFAEAHLKIAYVAWKADDPAAMRPHIEAAAAIYEARKRGGVPADARTEADIESGLGAYWKILGGRRSNAGDARGADAAFAEARAHLREALAREPGCVTALNLLLQIGAWTGAPEAEQDELKRRLAETQKFTDRAIDAHRSTFC